MNPEEIDMEKLTESCIQRFDRESLIIIGDKFEIEDYENIADLKFQILAKILTKNQVNQNPEFHTEEIKTIKESVLNEDKARRDFLFDYIEQVENIYKKIQRLDKIKVKLSENRIGEKDDPLKSRIKNEFKNFEQRLENIKKTIKVSFKCSLLVCGDSGSGKSSFINLLVKRDILPVSIRTNTACQVRLTFGGNEYAEVVERDGTKKRIEKEKFSKELTAYIEKYDERDQVSCNSVTINMESSILQGGLDIYDTIGLGESDFFNEHLLKDLSNITGVIFLLKKNNPIGENTVGGLSKIIDHIMTNDVPSSSMYFVINMCDQLDKSEDIKDLKKNVIKQIKERCVGLNPEVITFSTKQEQFLQRQNLMSENYKHLLKHIQDLYINSVNTKTILIYEFLNNFVWKSVDCIVESEKFTEDDRFEKQDYIRKLRNSVKDHKKSKESFTQKSNDLIRKYYNNFSKIIKAHFNQQGTRRKVIEEVVQNDYMNFGMSKEEEIEKEINEKTCNAIMKEFKEFAVKEKMLEKCNGEMLELFLKHYAAHLNNKHKYNKIIATNIDSTMNRIESDLKITNLNDLLALSNEKRKILSVFAPLIIPVVRMTCTIKQEFGNLFSFFLSTMNRSNIHIFVNNPKSYIRKKSNVYYKKFFPKHKDTIINSFLHSTGEATKKFKDYLEESMNDLTTNIFLLEDDMRKRKMVIKTYKDIKSGLESIRENFCRFYLLHYHKDKYNVMIDQIDSDLKAESGSEPILINRNRVVYNGHFKDMDKTDSSILMYKSLDKKTMKDLYLEYIKHKEIVQLTQKDSSLPSVNCFMKIRFHILSNVGDPNYVYPMFIINGIDCSLRKYIDDFRSEIPRQSDECLYNEICRILKQVLYGLEFLHEQTPPSNHYDLTIDSIGYNSTQNAIKLSSISNETKVLVDYKQTTTKYVEEMSHLPLKILEENSEVKYSKTTDIYCLGTILYYEWVGTLPLFKEILDKQINTIKKLVDYLHLHNIQSGVLSGCFKSNFGSKMLKACKMCWKDQTMIRDLNFLFN